MVNQSIFLLHCFNPYLYLSEGLIILLSFNFLSILVNVLHGFEHPVLALSALCALTGFPSFPVRQYPTLYRLHETYPTY